MTALSWGWSFSFPADSSHTAGSTWTILQHDGPNHPGFWCNAANSPRILQGNEAKAKQFAAGQQAKKAVGGLKQATKVEKFVKTQEAKKGLEVGTALLLRSPSARTSCCASAAFFSSKTVPLRQCLFLV